MGRGLAITEDANLPTVFLGMIPPSISLKEKMILLQKLWNALKVMKRRTIT